jgi:hypothetical protein
VIAPLPPRPTPITAAATEPHFSPKEIGAMWGVHANTVRRLFIDMPGVLRLGTPKRGKRAYCTIRIPESVLIRVHRRLCQEGK